MDNESDDIILHEYECEIWEGGPCNCFDDGQADRDEQLYSDAIDSALYQL